MHMWQKLQKLRKEVMRTPGPIRAQLLLLTTLTASSVLSTGLLIFRPANGILGGSTSFKNASLEVVDANGRVRVTGRHTTEVLRNLQRTGNFWGTKPSVEKSSASTQPSEK